MKKLWSLLEWLDWYDVPPRKFWRFLLRKMDEKHGFKRMNYDY